MNENSVLTVILPVYNEEAGIYKNVLKIDEILNKDNIKHEFLLIEDGSRDNSWNEICRLNDKVQIRAFRFSRNFGKEAALMAAIKNVKTDVCVILDSDLQHPPEVIVKMYKMWLVEKYEIIEGVKTSRGKEFFVNKIGANLFYKMFSKLTGIDLERASDFRLIDKIVIDALNELPERQTFFRGLSTWVGFKRGFIEFDVAERVDGNTSWSIIGLFKLALSAITSFSSIPLHLVTFMGTILFLGSIILGFQTLYMKFYGTAVSGFTTVILLLLIIGSALMISLGIIGVYIEKIYNEVKLRPRYIISEKISYEKLKEE